MSVTVAKTAGFCFGVNRAVEMVLHLADKGKKVCTLGPIIHNTQMVEELKKRGVRTVESVTDAKPDEILVIRSHGVPEKIMTEAKEQGCEICDATCPFVAKIHKIVADNSGDGHPVIIAGDKFHSEVLGIIGHISGDYFVIKDEDELTELSKKGQIYGEIAPILVAQTTFNAELWLKCQKIFKKLYTNGKIFDTICNATSQRQEEASRMASVNDTMIVVGGRHSSNTAKLNEVCKKYCNNTIFVETAEELGNYDFGASENVGIVAGASTPAGIIKEVRKTMTEILNSVADNMEISDDMPFEEALEISLNQMSNDQKVKGIVLSVDSQEIKVDIGRKYTGIIKKSEYSYDQNIELEEAVKVGDELDLIIMKTNDQEGTILLSKRRYDSQAGFDKVLAAKDSGEIIEGKITEVVKGGVVATYEGMRVFIPASRATMSRNESLDDLKDTVASFRIIEIGRGRRVIGSIKSVLLEQKKELQDKFWAEVEENKVYNGVVKSLTPYGAFVDLGGVDGMIHISELSWSRIKHPSEVVNVGDTVEVYVKSIDAENKKISLGFKKAEDNPWEILKAKYSEGDVATVKVVSMTSYGAFANVIPGIDGLIHISQIANRRIEKPQDVLSVGEEVEAKIVGIDYDAKRVSLSIRALLPEEEKTEEVPATEETVAEETPVEEVTEAPIEETAEVPAAEETPVEE